VISSNYSADNVDGEDMQDWGRAEARDGPEEHLAKGFLPRVCAVACGWVEGNLSGLGF